MSTCQCIDLSLSMSVCWCVNMSICHYVDLSMSTCQCIDISLSMSICQCQHVDLSMYRPVNVNMSMHWQKSLSMAIYWSVNINMSMHWQKSQCQCVNMLICQCLNLSISTCQCMDRNVYFNLSMCRPSARTNLYQNSFIPKTSKDWNSLPTHVTSNPSLQEFKRYLDKDKVKVPQYFYYLEDRRCQILHTRLRLGCSSLNADLFKNHLSETDMCICGKPETAEHYFLECNKYITARAETIELIHHQINIDIILKGCPLYDNISN